MKRAHPTMQDFEKENLALRRAADEALTQLRDAGRRLSDILQDQCFMEGTPIEVSTAGEIVVEAIDAALRALDAAASKKSPAAASAGAPTRQQGQFLAYIREYMLRNFAGVAPTHAALQEFFNLTAPSVNSMLIRLERRGFIRRIPHQARAIELTIAPDWIPALDRPFKM
jgi:DNA-binding MarR family transcriptional regulator